MKICTSLVSVTGFLELVIHKKCIKKRRASKRNNSSVGAFSKMTQRNSSEQNCF